jgi:hypothetical protein
MTPVDPPVCFPSDAGGFDAGFAGDAAEAASK